MNCVFWLSSILFCVNLYLFSAIIFFYKVILIILTLKFKFIYILKNGVYLLYCFNVVTTPACLSNLSFCFYMYPSPVSQHKFTHPNITCSYCNACVLCSYCKSFRLDAWACEHMNADLILYNMTRELVNNMGSAPILFIIIGMELPTCSGTSKGKYFISFLHWYVRMWIEYTNN